MFVRRAAVVSAALLTLPLSAGPATAAARSSHLGLVVTPATVLVGGAVVVSGVASPALTGSNVVLQRADGRTWTTLAHQKSGAAGTFAFHVKAPKAAATGDGTTINRLLPVQVPLATGAVSIGAFAGGYAVMPDGSMLSWGENSEGSLGLGDLLPNHPTPTTVPGVSGAVYTSGSEATGFVVVASG